MEKVKVLRGLSKIKQVADHSQITKLPFIQNGMSYVKRRWFGEFYDDMSQGVPMELEGIKLLVPKQFVTHYAFHEYEPITRKTFMDGLKPGMVVVDVGAHIGSFTMLAAKLVGESGTVHAVEPSERNREFLDANVQLNSYKNVRVHPYAAGKVRAQRLFHLTGSSDSHGFYPHPNTGTLQTIEITQVPLDELIQGRVDAVKIDVEGAEIEVLEGMKEILLRNQELQLWAEWFPAGMRNAGYAPLDLPRKLLDLGFKEILVLDDQAKQIRTLQEVEGTISAGSLPTSWYANLCAKRN
jgi:FkbM family methyltransferase